MDQEVNEGARGALADLIEVEKRIEADLDSAKAEAARILEAARASANSLDVDHAGQLEAELASLRESIDRECEASINRLQERARAEKQRYASVDEAKLLELARFVAGRVVGSGTAP